jgi:hypothetical protein
MATSWPLGRAYLEEKILGRVGHMRHTSVNFGFRSRIDGKSSQESEGGGTAQHHSKNAAFPISHFHSRIVRLSPRGQVGLANVQHRIKVKTRLQAAKHKARSSTSLRAPHLLAVSAGGPLLSLHARTSAPFELTSRNSTPKLLILPPVLRIRFGKPLWG